MEEINLFINSCTKKELIKYIDLTDTKVNGFTKKFKNAPESLLKQALKRKLEDKNYSFFNGLLASLTKIYDFLNPINDFESFIINLTRNKEIIPEADALGVFLYNFPEKKEKILPKIKENIEKGNYIFDIKLENLEIDSQNVNDKFFSITGLNNLINDFYDDHIQSLKSTFLKNHDIEEYNECLNKVEGIDWIDFVKIYFELIKDYDEQIVYMSYLNANENKIKNYKGEITRLHLLLIYELYLELTIEDKNKIESKVEQIVKENESLKERIEYLEKNEQRQLRINNKLETNNIKLKNKMNQNEKKFKEERNELNDIINKKNSKIRKQKKEINKFKIENENLIQKEELLNHWGYSKKNTPKNNLVILSYEDSSLFKLFFGRYEFINTSINSNDLKQKLSNNEKIIIINKAHLNTQKLLEIENYINSKKNVLLSYNPKDLVIKIIKVMEKENINIL